MLPFNVHTIALNIHAIALDVHTIGWVCGAAGSARVLQEPEAGGAAKRGDYRGRAPHLHRAHQGGGQG
eukprot:6023896-Pyramimonas_sp.AAC.1